MFTIQVISSQKIRKEDCTYNTHLLVIWISANLNRICDWVTNKPKKKKIIFWLGKLLVSILINHEIKELSSQN